jgi:hypothetical protein
MSHIVIILNVIKPSIAASLHYQTAKSWKHRNPTLKFRNIKTTQRKETQNLP